MQEIISKVDQVIEKLQTKDTNQIFEGLNILNVLFRANYPLDEER